VTSRQLANLYARLGLAYENLNNSGDAISAYQKAFQEHEKLDPEVQKILIGEIDYAFHLGLLLFKENKLDEAKPYLLESKRLTNAFETNYELGFLFFVQQDYEKALLVLGDGIAQIQKLKISKKGQAQIYKLVAAVWMNKSNPDLQKADQFLKQSIEAFRNKDSCSDLGNLYALQKLYPKALSSYQEALTLPALFDLPDSEIEKTNQYLKEKIDEMNNKLKG
jgi:tetratricopeptide (TPR) repeat protein